MWFVCLIIIIINIQQATILCDSYNLQIAEMLNNAYIDYFTTIEGIQHGYKELNPIGIYVFEQTKYKKELRPIIGVFYLIGLSQLNRLSEPYATELAYLFDIGHFFGAYSWRNTGFLLGDIKLTLFKVDF